MLLVILGAGASYDSDRRRSFVTSPPERRLPLAQDLFSPRFAEIARTYDAVQGILGVLQTAPNVEQALESLISQRQRYPRRVRQLLGATYYIREAIDKAEASWWDSTPDHVTNFVELVEVLDTWAADANESVVFVTFNYDTLLEKAIHAVIGKEFRQVDDYVAGKMPIFKLHGSVDWWQGVGGIASAENVGAVEWAGQMLEQADVIHPTGYFQVRAARTPTDGPVIPAISLPVLTKGDDAYACPGSHLEALRALLPSATNVLVLGWRGAEAHFYSLWKASYRAGQGGPKSMLIVDKDRGVIDVEEKLRRSAHWLPVARPFGGGFSELLNSGELDAFLSRLSPASS